MIDPSRQQLLHKLYRQLYEVLAYLITGVWNTVFGVGLYTLGYHLWGTDVHYMLLAIPVNILAITNAFLCYKFFVFRTKGNFLREYLRCYLVYGGGSLLGMGLLWLLVHCGKMRPDWANAVGTALVVVISFLGHKFYSFRKR